VCNPYTGLLLIAITGIRMSYVTVSAKIPRRLKELLDKYGIKPGPVIRRALEEEVKKHVLSELEEEARALSERLSHISDEEVASIIREDRERR
jgi:polyhydroxyalkanoate synthesis regulator phasin